MKSSGQVLGLFNRLDSPAQFRYNIKAQLGSTLKQDYGQLQAHVLPPMASPLFTLFAFVANYD